MSLTVEVPTGTINGTNRLFTTIDPIIGNPVVSVNGLIYTQTDTEFGFTFTSNSTIFTLNTIPLVNDVVLIIYDKD